MTRYLRNRITRHAPCYVTDLDGEPLPSGTVLTGGDVRGWIAGNGIITVDYRSPMPDVHEQDGANFLSRLKSDGTFALAVSAQYGDWFYPGNSVTAAADSVTIRINDPDYVEIVLEWQDFDLLGDGPPDYDVNYALAYDQGLSYPNFNRIASTRVRKIIGLVRGAEGYFFGLHTSPLLGPRAEVRATYEHETAFFEREFGTGSGTRKAFASGGKPPRTFPAQGQSAAWTAAEALLGPFANHAWWPGVSDTLAWSQSPYTAEQQAALAATQDAGFPDNQSAPPYWVADLWSEGPFCRYIVMQDRCEIGVWQYGNQYGNVVLHFANQGEGAGVIHRFVGFLGAFEYEVTDWNLEPSQALQDRVALKAAHIVFPEDFIP